MNSRVTEALGFVAFAAVATWLLLDRGLDWLIRRMMAVGGVHVP